MWKGKRWFIYKKKHSLKIQIKYECIWLLVCTFRGVYEKYMYRNINKLKTKDSPIITCCASGARSAAAKQILNANGFTNVHNGGSWMSLKQKYSL